MIGRIFNAKIATPIMEFITERRIVMLERFKNHCNNPITWGAYYKLCGISLAIWAAIIAAWVIKWTMDMRSLYKFENQTDSEEEES